MSAPSEDELSSAFDRCLFTNCEELNELDAGLFSADMMEEYFKKYFQQKIDKTSSGFFLPS